MKKTVVLLSLAFLMLCATQSFAQLRFGVKGGLNFANTLDKDNDETYSDDYTARTGFHLGITAEYGFSDNLYLEPGLLFSTKGFKYHNQQFDFELKGNINYLEIPLNLVYKFDLGTVKLFASAGPYLGYAISGKLTADKNILGDNGDKDEEEIKIGNNKDEDDMKALDLGMNIGAGVEINNITIGMQYGLGLSNFAVNTDNGYVNKNRVIGISVGYKFGEK